MRFFARRRAEKKFIIHHDSAPKNNISQATHAMLGTLDVIQQHCHSLRVAELQEFENMKIKHYSAGMKTRLAFSIAMQIDPDIILVDEVLSVGDFTFREKSLRAFLSFKDRKKTILFATHILAPLPELCDRVLVLDKGKMIFLGDPREAIQRYRKIRED